MAVFHEIMAILQKNGYTNNEDTNVRVRQLLECLKDESQFHTLAEVQEWFKEITEGRKDFWTTVQAPYRRRDISRERVTALIDLGLRATRGSYKAVAALFHVEEGEYRRFMDFLRRSHCLLDFRPYRKAAAASREN